MGPGCGDVVGGAGFYWGGPQREAGGVGDDWDTIAESLVLTRVLGVITGLRPFGDPIGGNQRALKRHVGQMIVLCLGQGLVQLGSLGGRLHPAGRNQPLPRRRVETPMKNPAPTWSAVTRGARSRTRTPGSGSLSSRRRGTVWRNPWGMRWPHPLHGQWAASTPSPARKTEAPPRTRGPPRPTPGSTPACRSSH